MFHELLLFYMKFKCVIGVSKFHVCMHVCVPVYAFLSVRNTNVCVRVCLYMYT